MGKKNDTPPVMRVGADGPVKRNPEVWRPVPGRCNLHGKTLDVPIDVNVDGKDSCRWICIVCVEKRLWNDEIFAQVKKNWPTELNLGPLARQAFDHKEAGGVKRKGGTGV